MGRRATNEQQRVLHSVRQLVIARLSHVFQSVRIDQVRQSTARLVQKGREEDRASKAGGRRHDDDLDLVGELQEEEAQLQRQHLSHAHCGQRGGRRPPQGSKVGQGSVGGRNHALRFRRRAEIQLRVVFRGHREAGRHVLRRVLFRRSPAFAGFGPQSDFEAEDVVVVAQRRRLPQR